MTITNERPTALELLDAVREHLATRVVPNTRDPQLKFQTLVATHVLGVVLRELSTDPSVNARLDAARASLPGAPDDDAALCAMIRDGAFDDPAAGDALAQWLRARAELSLRWWNPAFLQRVSAG